MIRAKLFLNFNNFCTQKIWKLKIKQFKVSLALNNFNSTKITKEYFKSFLPNFVYLRYNLAIYWTDLVSIYITQALLDYIESSLISITGNLILKQNCSVRALIKWNFLPLFNLARGDSEAITMQINKTLVNNNNLITVRNLRIDQNFHANMVFPFQLRLPSGVRWLTGCFTLAYV